MFNFFKKKMAVAKIDKTEFFIAPERKHRTDAGLDLYIPYSFTLRGKATTIVNINLAVKIPHGYVGLILPRSSISCKGVHVCTGVVDEGFAGEIKVVVKNMDKRPKRFEQGFRIAQLVVVPCWFGDTEEVEHQDLINSSVGTRGTSGYGSTGK